MDVSDSSAPRVTVAGVDVMTTTLVFVLVLGGLVAAIGRAAWPRSTRPLGSRALREDLTIGLAVVRGAGVNHERTIDRYLRELNRES